MPVPLCEPIATKIVAVYARIAGSGRLLEHCKRAELLRRAVSLLEKIKRIVAKRGNRPIPSVAKVLSNQVALSHLLDQER